ncbi:hypothetical protein PINS_up000073 [Pythium insidiosum]|nr:hypothetical protein PINS_up000073 [Pythium insidiosum]
MQNEQIEENEMKLQLMRKELDNAKEERDRHQQREMDARAETHDVRMRLEELENKRRIEFEEYRAARTSLERECNVLRDKIAHTETLHQRHDDQKNQQIAQLEDDKYKLESQLHQQSLSAGYVTVQADQSSESLISNGGISVQQDEYAKLKKEFQDAVRDRERAEQQLRTAHSTELAAIQRQQDQIVKALESQQALAQEQLQGYKQSINALKEGNDDLQATVLRLKLTHEKELSELKRQWERDQQERLERSVAAVEAQLDDVKKSRLFLEKEVEKHMETIMRLRNENLSLQQAHDSRLHSLQEELERQYKELQDKQDQLSLAQKEGAVVQEKVKALQRRLDEQERVTVRLRETYEDRIKVSLSIGIGYRVCLQ